MIALHPHQQIALDRLRHSLATGHRRPMLQAPTGMGKTIVAAEIVSRALSKGKRVIFGVPYLSLVDQTVAAFERFGVRDIGVLQADHPMTDLRRPVQVASLQTLARRRIPAADLVVLDEAHRWFRHTGEWMAAPEWQRVPFVGLSATPWTRGLGKHYDDLIVATTTRELIAGGYLAPYRVFAPAHPDLTGVKTVAGDYHEGQLAEAMNKPTLVADVASTWLRLGEDRPTLCFAVDRAHARSLADQFEVAGVPSAYIDMNTPADERRQIGERLRLGQIRVVCNVYTLTAGIDWDVRCIILARPTKSESLFVQIIGRGLRTAEGKADCLILDHSDTVVRLGFPADIHHEHLDDGRPRQAGGVRKERETPLPKECAKCSYLKEPKVHTCPNCGFAPERQSKIECLDGDLIQLNGRRRTKGEAEHSRQDFYSMLLWVQRDRKHADGWVGHKFREKFNVWPRGLERLPKPPDAIFSNWLRYQAIRFAKSKQKREAGHAAA